MTPRQKNMVGAAGLTVLLLAAGGYAAWSYWPRSLRHHPALGVDVSNYTAPQIIDFIRGLGDLTQIIESDRVALFKKVKARFDAMPPADKVMLLKAAMDAFNAGKSDPVMVNGRELMKAYQHEMLTEYFKADADKRRKILDERIREQEMMESLRKFGDIAAMFGSRDKSREERLNMMRRQIGEAIEDAMRNGRAEDRAMMTQFMLDMRQRRMDRGLKVIF